MEMNGSDMHQALENIFSFVPTLILKSAVLLNIPDIIANAGPDASLSLHEIAAKLPTKTLSVHYLSRILAFLSARGVFIQTQATDNPSDLRYVLSSFAKRFYVKDNNPSTLVPLLLMHADPVIMASWHHLHECVLVQGCNGFEKAHGKDLWAYGKEEPRVNNLVNDSMSALTYLEMEQILNCYDGFKEVNSLVDVGGGKGTALAHIVKAYPHIHGINFDQPHVVQKAPTVPGIKNVGGSMFKSIPSTDAIFMKNVLVDWDDQSCERILENCYNAFPENGKFLLAEYMTREESKENESLDIVMDLVMNVLANGGKQRSEQEWRSLLQNSGFNVVKIVGLSGICGKEKFIEAIKK
ncbi:hypothetical protein KI387_021475 [Taxus chinensis]|uniref:O-methyltransferase n=1 Tax=Taxus chinensis TaxID=29808 RepID=A0AA38GAU0_TAXCH|nr:hypothetical protein KI387_021475 [Taxus chinensis]